MSDENKVTDLPGFRAVRDNLNAEFIDVIRETDLFIEENLKEIRAMGAHRWDVQLIEQFAEAFLQRHREHIRISRIAIPFQLRWAVCAEEGERGRVGMLSIYGGTDSTWQKEVARISLNVVPVHALRNAPTLSADFAMPLAAHLRSWNLDVAEHAGTGYGLLFLLVPFITALQSFLPHSDLNPSIEAPRPAADIFQYGKLRHVPTGLIGKFFRPLDTFTCLRMNVLYSDAATRAFDQAVADGHFTP